MGFLEKLKRQIRVEEKKEDWLEKEGRLIVDVYFTKQDLVIETPVPGVKEDEIQVFFENDILTIEGERKKPEEEREYLIQECFFGKFSRKIQIPLEVNTEKIEATLKNGILKIKIPRLRKLEKMKIEVK